MTKDGAQSGTPEHPVVRSYLPEDHPAVLRLYSEGLLIGQLLPNDTGADLEDIRREYLTNRRTHFWVVEVGRQVQGMIAVAIDDPHTAAIRRLRVARELQQTSVPGLLVETAIKHCKHHGFIKVILDTRYERTATLDIFSRHGFEHSRTRSAHGLDVLEFYLDIYRPRKSVANY